MHHENPNARTNTLQKVYYPIYFFNINGRVDTIPENWMYAIKMLI